MDIFTRFKTAVKIRELQVDNSVFQLHYRVTASFLLICAALVASKQHFGDPIDCITKDDVPIKLMDTYCWIHSTFTLPSACNKTVGLEVAHPCVDSSNTERSHEDRVYHKYYQWVYFVLFFQAACFYAPHFFWKATEAKLLAKLCSDLKNPLFKDNEKFGQAKAVALYFKRHNYRHRNYFYNFIMFEVINLLNVIGQMYLVDEFLGGTFTSYGLDVLNYSQMDQDERFDPMVRVFPRMTKCTFHRFGASGDVQRYDSLCILPLNIINEKIYIIMWFWFIFLSFVTAAWLIYRVLTLTKPTLRFTILKRKATFANKKKLKTILMCTDTGDWFLLSMVCKNIDSRWFEFIVNKLEKLYSDEQAENERKRRSQRNKGRRTSRGNRGDGVQASNNGQNDRDCEVSILMDDTDSEIDLDVEEKYSDSNHHGDEQLKAVDRSEAVKDDERG